MATTGTPSNAARCIVPGAIVWPGRTLRRDTGRFLLADCQLPIADCWLPVERWTFLRRIRTRYEGSVANDVPAALVFASRARFGSVTTSSNARDNQPCAEFRLTRTQEQHAANLGKESRHQNRA